MRFRTAINIRMLSFMLGLLALGCAVSLQAQMRTQLQGRLQLFDDRNGDMQFDLTELIRQQAAISGSSLTITELRFKAKSDLGGAQIYLVVNDNYIMGDVIDTDPALFAGEEQGYEQHQWMLDEPMPVQQAHLLITPRDRAKIKDLEFILQSTTQAARPAPVVNMPEVKPQPIVTPAPVVQAPPTPAPVSPRVVTAPPQQVRTPAPPPRDCLVTSRRQTICKGDWVENSVGRAAQVVHVYKDKNQLGVRFEGESGVVVRDSVHFIVIDEP